jgi:hypothetical protein
MALKDSIKQRLLQWRGYLFALLAVAIVWVVSAMSEQQRFREQYNVLFTGFDTVRYATISCDSILPLEVTSNGFRAFARGKDNSRIIRINISKLLPNNDSDDFKLSVKTNDIADNIRSQIDSRGVDNINILSEKMEIHLAKRESKKFAPNIANVLFQFEGMTGLAGEPTITPDSVTLYGSRASLDKIKSINALPQTVGHIRISGKHIVKLDTAWMRYKDLRISNKTIAVSLPVETFIENEITLPVHIMDVSDKDDHSDCVINAYPSTVTLHYLVPANSYNNANADDFFVSAHKSNKDDNKLITHVDRFPSNVKIKTIEPEEIQYIIICK